MLRWVDIICAICNCYIPGINDAHVEILENILDDEILNVAMKVTESFCIIVHLPDIFCLDDNHSVWASHKKTLNSFVDTEGPSDKNINGKGSEMLAQRNNNDSILLPSSSVNYPGHVLHHFDGVVQ